MSRCIHSLLTFDIVAERRTRNILYVTCIYSSERKLAPPFVALKKIAEEEKECWCNSFTSMTKWMRLEIDFLCVVQDTCEHKRCLFGRFMQYLQHCKGEKNIELSFVTHPLILTPYLPRSWYRRHIEKGWVKRDNVPAKEWVRRVIRPHSTF